MNCILHPWLLELYNDIIRYIRSDGLNHSMLIKAKFKSDANLLVLAISSFLMCTNITNNASCKRCKNCYLILNSIHPDFHILDDTMSSKKISIDRIYDLSEKLRLSAQTSEIKVVWLTDIDILSAEALNFLIKLIDVTHKKTWFIINIYNNNMFTVNIRSRCTYWYIKSPQSSVSYSWIKKYNKKFNTAHIISALRFTNNNPNDALNFLNTLHSKRKQFYYDLSESISRSDLIVKLFLKHNNVLQAIFWFITLLVDVIKYKLSRRLLLFYNLDHYLLIRKISNMFSFNFVEQNLVTLIRCYHAIYSCKHIDCELVLMNFFMKWNSLL